MPSCPSRLAALATATLTLSSTAPYAQTAVPQLETVVVTPARGPQLLQNVSGDITIVDRTTLQQAGSDSVAEILARQPGVLVTENGGRQTPTGVMLRGANANHTLLLIDGMRVNSAVQGGANWSALDPAAIERVEILRGAASSLYGSDAIGGVINIITRKGETDRPLSAWADIGIGSHETFRTSTGFSGATAGWDYSLTASMANSEGYSTTRPEVPWANYHRDDDGYSQHTLAGTLVHRWAAGHHLGLTFYNSYINGEYDSGAWTHPAHAITRQQAYSLTSTNAVTDRWESVVKLGLSKETYDDRVWDTRFSSLQRSYSWQHNLTIKPDQRLSVYFERLEERPTHSADMTVNQRNTNATGAIYSGRIGRHSLQASLRNDNISSYGNEVTGGLGYDFHVNEVWSVGLAGNTGFHAPTFSDLYYPGSENPDLSPEKSRNLEARLRYQDQGLDLGLTIYQNKIRDLLTWDNTTFRMENVNRATLRGATLTAEYAWDNTTLRASADLLRARDDATGEQLLRRPRHQYMLAAEHRISDLRLGLEYRFTGKSEDTAVDPVTFSSYRTTLGSYNLVNLTAGYDLNRHTSVQIRWNNVFDKRYVNAYGYNTPGSTLFVNLSLKM